MIKRCFGTGSNNIITVTKSAWKRSQDISDKINNPHFIFSAKGGGCGGFSYELKTADEEIPVGTTLQRDGIQLTVDPMSELYLVGTTITYIVENPQAGIWESKFEYIPDSKMATACGCGISFNPRTPDR